MLGVKMYRERKCTGSENVGSETVRSENVRSETEGAKTW